MKTTMKRKNYTYLIISCLLSCTSVAAQSLRDAFKAMPDALMPGLTANNRLDMMDFMDARMKASVDNKLGGRSEMTFLADDSLAIRMSDALTVEMKRQQSDTTVTVCMKRTYHTTAGQIQTVLTRYDASSWQPLGPTETIVSTLEEFDEKINTKDTL